MAGPPLPPAGMPQAQAGAALMAALAASKRKKKPGMPMQLGTRPQASGGTVTGASTSMTRVGY